MAKQFELEQTPDILEVGTQRVPIKILRNRRAKRIYLRYNPADHIFSLTLPHRARLSDGVDFIESKSDWITQTLKQMPSKRRLRNNLVIPVLGQKTVIAHCEDLPAPFALKDNMLQIGGSRTNLSPRIEHALRKIVRHEITELSEYKAAQLGKSINRVTLRDTSSRWGSCSSEHNLMFSWRLVFAPYEVLDYVVSHEVAHLKHMNHGPRFWQTVESICPNYEEWKDWLRYHGKELYCFTSE